VREHLSTIGIVRKAFYHRIKTFYIRFDSTDTCLCPTEFPPITEGYELDRNVGRRLELFLQFCRGRFQIDHNLFKCRNLPIFQEQYRRYVKRITPKDEGPVID